MTIEEIIQLLPSHWKVIPVNPEQDHHYSDDSRDYYKPMFIRKDGLARIYFNDMASPDCIFAISWDLHSDGDCRADFMDALKEADDYVKKYPIQVRVEIGSINGKSNQGDNHD